MMRLSKTVSVVWMVIFVKANLVSLSTAAVVLHYGRNVIEANNVKLASWREVSVTECEVKCSNRYKCMSAVYHVHFGWCVLYKTQVSPTDGMQRKAGVITMTGFKKTKPEAVTCGQNTCEKTEACTGGGVPPYKDECKITECGRPNDKIYHDVFKGTHLGNMYNVGSKLVLIHRGQRLQTICKENGVWSHWEDRNKPESYDCTDVAEDVVGDASNFLFPIFSVQSLNLIRCKFTTNGNAWLVFQRQRNSSEKIQRYMNNCVTGFGNQAGQFWLGLERLHDITMVNQMGYEYEMRIDMQNDQGDTYIIKYSAFHICSAEDGYSVHVDASSKDSVAALRFKNGSHFPAIHDQGSVPHCGNTTFTGGWLWKSNGSCESILSWVNNIRKTLNENSSGFFLRAMKIRRKD